MNCQLKAIVKLIQHFNFQAQFPNYRLKASSYSASSYFADLIIVDKCVNSVREN